MKSIDHAAYQARTRTMSEESLRYVIADCRAVIAAQSDFNPNVGVYADEMHYCCMELARRQREAKRAR